MGYPNPVIGSGGDNLVYIGSKGKFLISPRSAPIKLDRNERNILHFNLAAFGRCL